MKRSTHLLIAGLRREHDECCSLTRLQIADLYRAQRAVGCQVGIHPNLRRRLIDRGLFANHPTSDGQLV